MGIVKQHELEKFEDEEARLDREFEEFRKANSDLVGDMDRETWEAMEHALDKDD